MERGAIICRAEEINCEMVSGTGLLKIHISINAGKCVYIITTSLTFTITTC